MELEEAIQHCLEKAANNETCKECKDEHLQLAEWLIELKVRRMTQVSLIYSIPPPTLPISIQPYERIGPVYNPYP